MENQASNYKQFCELMTRVAENQLDMHRANYYPICVSNRDLLFLFGLTDSDVCGNGWQRDSYA